MLQKKTVFRDDHRWHLLAQPICVGRLEGTVEAGAPTCVGRPHRRARRGLACALRSHPPERRNAAELLLSDLRFSGAQSRFSSGGASRGLAAPLPQQRQRRESTACPTIPSFDGLSEKRDELMRQRRRQRAGHQFCETVGGSRIACIGLFSQKLSGHLDVHVLFMPAYS